MPFLLAMDLWVANEASLKQALPTAVDKERVVEKVLPSSREENSLEKLLSNDPAKEIKPFVLEGSVESFDPVLRAIDLAKTIARDWCGSYQSFEDDENVQVSLKLIEVKAIGQIVHLTGDMTFGYATTPVTGHLNAKSDQMELIPLSEKLIPGLEPGGYFVGLQGARIFGWKSPRLDNPGGRLELKEKCEEELSKAPVVNTIW